MRELHRVLKGNAMPTEPQDTRCSRSVSNATIKDKQPDVIITVV